MGHAIDLERLMGPPMTVEEWAALPDDVPGEIVEGRLVEEEVPDLVHEVIVMWLGWVLGNWAVQSGAIVAGSGGKFAVSDRGGRKPDLTVFFKGQRPPAHGLVRMAPDIAIEVVSPQARDVRRDRVEKLAEYAAFGIRYYWLVEFKTRTFEIHELGPDAKYVQSVQQQSGVIAAVPGCDGLSLDVDALWAKAAELETE